MSLRRLLAVLLVPVCFASCQRPEGRTAEETAPNSASSSGQAGDGQGYRIAFSTYLGGAKWEHARDVVTDPQGNIYAVGSAVGGWPTVRAFQDKYAGTNDPRWVDGDAVIIKLEPVSGGAANHE